MLEMTTVSLATRILPYVVFCDGVESLSFEFQVLAFRYISVQEALYMSAPMHIGNPYRVSRVY
jgi:hypothetical protein